MSKPAYALGLFCLASVLLNVYFFLGRQDSRGSSLPPAPTTIEIAQDIKVPEPRTTPSSVGLAVPKTVQESLPGAISKIRTFDVQANAGSFTIDKIAVYQNDIVHLNITAIDKVYDFTVDHLGLSQTVSPGQTKTIEFQAMTPGTYLFSCKSCATEKKSAFEGTQKVPQGVILVIARQLT